VNIFDQFDDADSVRGHHWARYPNVQLPVFVQNIILSEMVTTCSEFKGTLFAIGFVLLACTYIRS
jgi:hypothetical protein